MCEFKIVDLWRLTLFIGVWLLIMCAILSNSPPETFTHNMMIVCGIAGSIIFVLCISIAICYKPITRVLYSNTLTENLLQNTESNLSQEPIITDNKELNPDSVSTSYIQNNIPELETTDDIVIAESINQV